MKILYRRCAGLDVHKKTVCACIREASSDGEVEITEATFDTFTDGLEQLRDWLKEHEVRRVAMESTGVYWIPVWNVLAPVKHGLEPLLVNPTLVKALPGSKTDVKDAERIAELHQYGLLRGSFIPPRPIRRLRDLTRRRTHLRQDQNRVTNRIGRLLECANVKLGSVASNIVGVSGRKMLRAMARGEGGPVQWAAMALGKLKEKEGELVRALNGRFNDHFRYLLTDLLNDQEYLQKKIDSLGHHIETELAGKEEVIERLCTIPGVDHITAWTIVAEIGLDMSAFEDAAHLASWAGLCPGNNESAGKRLGGRARKGDRYLRRALVQVAWAIAHTTDGNFLNATFFRIARRRGLKKAALAVAHRVLLIAYYILRDGTEYRELGGDYYDRLHPERTMKRLVARLESLGMQVEVRRRPELGEPAPRRARVAPAQLPPTEKLPAPISQAEPKPGRKRSRPRKSPPEMVAPGCRKCARWGIPCIHVKRHFPEPPQGASTPESTG